MPSLSKALLNDMGFSENPAALQLEAAFYGLYVFQVRGVQVQDEPDALAGPIAVGSDCALAFGLGVNRLSRLLGCPDFDENEDAWTKERRVTGPLVMVRLGPTRNFKSTSSLAKWSGDRWETYEAFSAAKDELAHLASVRLPSIFSSLVVSLSRSGQHVAVAEVQRAVFGVALDGSVILDVRVDVRAHASVSHPRKFEETKSDVAAAAAISERIAPTSAQFLALGLRESDPVKAFLYLFLAVETTTHQCFAEVRGLATVDRLSRCAARIEKGAAVLSALSEDDRYRTLRARFIWCAVLSWEHISDDEVTAFSALLRVRHELAHGARMAPDEAHVRAIRRLVLTLFASLRDGPWPEAADVGGSSGRAKGTA